MLGQTACMAEPAQPPQAIRFRVNHIDVMGVTVVPHREIDALLLPYLGRDLTLQDLQQLSARIQQVYRQHGFEEASAYVPAQNVSNGTAQIAVLEGRLGQIRVRGNRHYSAAFVKRYLANVTYQGVLQESRLRHALLLLNDLPDLKAQAVLQPGDAPGTTDVVLMVHDDGRLHGQFEYNDFGPAQNGQNRTELDLDKANLAIQGDQISLRSFYSFPAVQGSLTYQTIYEAPLERPGLKLQASFTSSNQVVEDGLQAVSLVGQTSISTLGLVDTVQRELDKTSTVSLLFQSKSFNNLILGEELSHDEIRSVQAAYTTVRDRLHTRDILTLTATEGLGGFMGGTPNGSTEASRAGAGNNFTKLDVDAAHLVTVGRCSWLLRADAQYAANPLLVGEEFAIGGADSVRGFNQGEATGDAGYSTSVEYRFPLEAAHDDYQGALFADRGSVRVLDPSIGQQVTFEMTGVGVGLRLRLPSHMVGRVDLGQPLNAALPTDNRSPFLYTQLVSTF
jgi:hemolysin activation/secretion protein